MKYRHIILVSIVSLSIGVFGFVADHTQAQVTGEFCREYADYCQFNNLENPLQNFEESCRDKLYEVDGEQYACEPFNRSITLRADETGCGVSSTGPCVNLCFGRTDTLLRWTAGSQCFDTNEECIEAANPNEDPDELSNPYCGQRNDDSDLDPSDSINSFTGGGISAAFKLDGFKPFENVEGLYVRDGETASIPQFINTFLGFIIGISGAAVVVIIVVSGFQYVTAAAGASKTASKERVTEALIGLVILLCSVAILNTINPRLLNLDQLEPIEVNITQQEFEGGRTGYGGGSRDPRDVGGNTPSAGDVGSWQAEMTAAASSNGLSYCMVEALVATESMGNHLIASNIRWGAGCPANACTPIDPIPVDRRDDPAPGHYGMEFIGDASGTQGHVAHAIGLTQITIYGPDHWGGSPVPARPERELRYGGTRNLTVEMLIDPRLNVDVGSKYFEWILNNTQANGDPIKAYSGYNLGPTDANTSRVSSEAQKYRNYYRACVARQ